MTALEHLRGRVLERLRGPVLEALRDQDYTTPDLAEHLGVSRSTVWPVLRELTARGDVRRHPLGGHPRSPCTYSLVIK